MKTGNTDAISAKDSLLAMIRDGRQMTLRQQISLAARLSVPAMLAQLSTIVMEYIDASMVGRLGADDSASIGLVSSSIWLFGGVCSAVATGFSVQVAQMIGGNRDKDARSVLRQAILTCLLFSILIALVGVITSPHLPVWLGGHNAIVPGATVYFAIFMMGTPFLMLEMLAGSMLRCAGNMRVPSMLNVLMCVLDVVFNFLLIFPTRTLTLFGITFEMPGAGLGVMGAAIGTITAELVVCVLMTAYLLLREPLLNLRQDSGSFRPRRTTIVQAWNIGFPMGLQHVILCTAHIAIITIVAPLGSIAIAANAFAVTAESLCYMPGYGISDAATTLIGQSVGAGRRYLARHFATITVAMGMAVMGLMGVFLYMAAPLMMSILSPVPEVVSLGAECLRIEAFAEPLFAAAIVTYGVFVGAGDTMTPCWMNVVSMWAVRLSLAVVLVGSMGLTGVWTAMCIELCFRGSIFLIRLRSGRWLKKAKAASSPK